MEIAACYGTMRKCEIRKFKLFPEAVDIASGGNCLFSAIFAMQSLNIINFEVKIAGNKRV